MKRQIDQADIASVPFSVRRLLRAAMQTTTVVGLAALVIGNVTFAIYFDRQKQNEIATARFNAANLNTAFEQHIISAIRNIDLALLVARAEFERDPARFSVEQVARRDYFPKDLAVQLATIGADGWMRSSNLQTSGALDLSDREHFRVHVGNPRDELFISKPVLGRVSQVWTIQFTRKLRDAKGQFAGVLVASVDPHLLSRLYNSIDVGKSGAITLWGTDGAVRARSGMSSDVLGRTLSPPAVQHALAGVSSGTYENTSVVDGVTRLISFRAIPDYPLVVSVALGLDELLAEHERSKAAMLRLVLVIDAALLLIMGFGTVEKYRLNMTREKLHVKAHVLSSTLANMQEGILIVDAQDRVVTINEQAITLLGLAPMSLSLPMAYAKLPLLKREEKLGGVLQDHLELELQAGQIIEVRTSPLPDGGFVKTLNDVSARRRDQDALREARDRAETASRARTAFLATMSHEIRTPLSGIVSMADLMATTPLDQVQRRYVEITRDSAEHLLELLSDVLDVTKLDAAQVQLEAIDFDLLHQLRSALDIVSPKALEKGLPIGCIIAPDVPRALNGDPGRLRQVLINLIGNAIKFTKAGRVLLDVSRVHDEKGEHLLVSIEDTGIGISPENQRDLFLDFSQVDSSISRRFGGTGLGLAISRKLVTRMGGTIGVNSALNRGSTFFFQIPLTGFQEPEHFPLQDMAVAIATRNNFERRLFERQLKPAFARVASFEDTSTAIDWLQRGSGDTRRVLLANASAVPEGSHLSDRGFEAFLLCPRQDFLAHEYASAHGFVGLVQTPIFLDDLRASLAQPTVRPLDIREVNQVSPLAGTLTGLHFLLAEDNVTNQFALSRMLENMGAQVTAVKDGREALEAARLRAFDVVVMDVMMPELDGLAAARAIRALDVAWHNMPMVALTASAFAEDREAAFAAGMNGFATKPITARRLLDAIQACLHRTDDASTDDGAQRADELPLLDRKWLKQLSEDLGAQNLTQALTVFLDDLQRRIDALRDGELAADALRREAHAIKGSAASFGFRRVAHAAEQLELAARQGRNGQFEVLRAALLREAAAAADPLLVV